MKHRSRKEKLDLLQKENWDCVFIGGGSIGTGSGLDAALRGLKTVILEKEDFSAGTSSKSTKLIHGGVRYLSQFQFPLIKESLKERKILLRNAPHLVKPIKFYLPCYEFYEIPYYHIGLSIYDSLAGDSGLPKHKRIGISETLKELPYLKRKHLKGAITYYDASFNDSRLNLVLARSAEESGALALNQMETITFHKENEKITSCTVKDRLTGSLIKIQSKLFINVCGSGLDSIRLLDDPECKPVLKPSKGVHLVFPMGKKPIRQGMILPKTKDGRVVFLIPWENYMVLGTTDTGVSDPNSPPTVEASDIAYLLETINPYLESPYTLKDITSSFAGYRPLIHSRTAQSKDLSREESIWESPSGLITMGGGKWTTYRSISEKLVDTISRKLDKFTPSHTETFLLPGAKGYVDNLYIDISQKYRIDTDIAKRLRDMYGAEVFQILGEKPQPIAGMDGYFKEEIQYFVEKEFAQSVIDILGRRFRLLFVDLERSKNFARPILEILGGLKKWDSNRMKKEYSECLKTIDALVRKK